MKKQSTNHKTFATDTVLPGDMSQEEYIERTLRVNHAGEYGAKYIYEGQLAVLKKKQSKNVQVIQHMHDQECEHLEYFHNELNRRKIRPSLFSPLWRIGGFALGAVTASMSEKAAMACTVAVEEVIDKHYEDQLKKLPRSENNLKNKIQKFQADELEHRDTALACEAEKTVTYPVLTKVISQISKMAISVAKKY